MHTFTPSFRKGKGISIADQNAIALGAAGSPKVMTQTDVIHSANVDHQFNPKPKPFAFSPSSTPAAQSTSPAKVAAPTSSVHAPKFDPGAYARKKCVQIILFNYIHFEYLTCNALSHF